MTIPQDASIQIDVEKGNMLMENFLFESNELVAMGRQGAEEKHEIAWYLMDALCDLAWPQLTGPLYRPAFYLPADRTGVMHAHRVVVSAMIGSARMTGLRPTGQTPMLSGVLADFLQQLIDIDHPPSGRRKKQGDLGSSIEESILGGSVRVDRSEMIDYPHFTYKPRGWKEPLHLMNASSMVSELAPVVLYLRHVVERGNLLIVEEPESHLHPAMQVEFTRQLAKLILKGVRVIITTHSEWILEELANVVRRSELPDSRRQEVPQGNYSLRSDQVGVWLFKPQLKPKGSLVEEIPIDDSGLFPSGFEEVATALHNDWAGNFQIEWRGQMNGLVAMVRNKVHESCLTNGRIRKSGCSANLNGAPQPRLIIDFDRPGAPIGPSPGTLRLSVRGDWRRELGLGRNFGN